MLSTGVGGGGDTDIDWSAVAKGNPSGRVGTPEDIAGLSISLSSRAGAYTVGEVISCDGGSTTPPRRTTRRRTNLGQKKARSKSAFFARWSDYRQRCRLLVVLFVLE